MGQPTVRLCTFTFLERTIQARRPLDERSGENLLRKPVGRTLFSLSAAHGMGRKYILPTSAGLAGLNRALPSRTYLSPSQRHVGHATLAGVSLDKVGVQRPFRQPLHPCGQYYAQGAPSQEADRKS